jgi:hypothetical protein
MATFTIHGHIYHSRCPMHVSPYWEHASLCLAFSLINTYEESPYMSKKPKTISRTTRPRHLTLGFKRSSYYPYYILGSSFGRSCHPSVSRAAGQKRDCQVQITFFLVEGYTMYCYRSSPVECHLCTCSFVFADPPDLRNQLYRLRCGLACTFDARHYANTPVERYSYKGRL